jgi:hypothetical protein
MGSVIGVGSAALAYSAVHDAGLDHDRASAAAWTGAGAGALTGIFAGGLAGLAAVHMADPAGRAVFQTGAEVMRFAGKTGLAAGITAALIGAGYAVVRHGD